MKYLKKFNLFEAVGVPANIVETAEQIINDIMAIKFDNVPYDYLADETLNLHNNYQISDIKLGRVDIKFRFVIDKKLEDKVIFAGLQIDTLSKVEPGKRKGYNLVAERKPISITFLLAIDSDSVIGKDIKNFLISKREFMVGTISHELKHAYDSIKNKSTDIRSDIDYESYLMVNFEDIKPLNNFFKDLYYMHETETLVRSSELFGEIKSSGITKKEFYNYFINSEMYKHLKEIRDFSYDKFKTQLKSYLPQLKEMLRKTNTDLMMSNDEIIEWFLDKAYNFLNLNKLERALDKFDLNNPMVALDSIVGMDANLNDKYRNEFLKAYKDRTHRFKNYEEFYEYEIKRMSKLAEKTIKKLSGLYSITKED